MAKVLCGISGIEFECQYLPLHLHSREYAHPIFYLPQPKLLGLYQKYRHAELDDTSSYLLFLAYLNSTDLVDWRVPARRTPKSSAIIANNFEDLVSTVEKMNRIKNPAIHFSHLSINPDTAALENVKYWIANWDSTYTEFTSGYAEQRFRMELSEIEERLEHLIKDANRSEVKFASRLADWADKAGNFPRFPVKLNGATVPCNEYWKQIIRKCTNAESIFTIPTKDIQELLDHCEESIDAGSIYGHNVFKILREGLQKQNNFLGLGDISEYKFSIVNDSDSVEKANKLAIIQNAPDHAPSRLEYTSQFAFLKAKLAWEMKQNMEAEEK